MAATYDSRNAIPAIAATGGSVSNFDRQQTSFHDEIGCLDAATFVKSAQQAGSAPSSPVTWTFKCTGACQKAASDCVTDLRSQVIQLRAAADKVQPEQGTTTDPSSPSSAVLFPGKQISGGSSRSPAWDGLEESSPWFPGTISGVPAPSYSALFDVRTKGFKLVDSWVQTPVSKLPGTISYAERASAWRLRAVEVQCVDDTAETEPWAAQTISNDRTEGCFTNQCQIPLLGTAQDELAYRMFAVGALRNARVLSAVNCCVELYHTAAKLLEMRDATMASGLETRIGGLRTTLKGAHFTKIPIKGNSLPPKLSGYATSPARDFEDLCQREGATGAMSNTSVLAMSLAYDRGVYGGSIAGMWALMDSGFMYDYSTGNFSKNLNGRIGDTFAVVRGQETGNADLDAHLSDIVTVVSCNFTAIKAKAALEDKRKLKSKPCIAIWDDLAAVARYRMADAAFAHVWYDSPNDQRSLVLGGLGCALHDLIDIGPDVSCGEVSNIIPSLTGGDLSIEALRSVYIGLVATLEWCANNDPFNTTGLAILFTHWWQLCNLRHRPVALMSRIEPSPEYAVCPAKLTSEPTFAAISHDNGIKFTTGQTVIDDQRAEVERIRAALDEADVTDLQGLIDKLVIPVLDYAEGKETCLPIEIEYCTDVLQGTMSRRHSEKIHALWALLLVMWKSGAIWMAVIANTQYAHQGMTNCDRGRDDYDATTWGQVEAEPEAEIEGAATVADAAPVESLSTGFSALNWLLSKLRQFILPLNTSL